MPAFKAVVPKVVAPEQDKFGIERFAAIRVQFNNFTLDKHSQNRLTRIETVFTYRRDVAYELHHLEERSNEWERRRTCHEMKTRLDALKPIQFFLDALQTLLDEVRKEAKPKVVRFSVY